MLAASGAIDDAFARSFAVQIERACRSVGGRYWRPSDALRSALPIVIQRAPQEIWPVLAGFYEASTSVERERLNAILAPTKMFASDALRSGPGALFATPLTMMLDWVQEEPATRISFLVSFFPILERHGAEWRWHPALKQLADSYGHLRNFRKALRSRIYPNSWGGSLNAHFTSFLAPLASWGKHPVLGE